MSAMVEMSRPLKRPSPRPSAAASSEKTSAEPRLLQLQRVIGNQAVQRLLIARAVDAPELEAAPTTTDLLSKAQVQKALSFYTSQPQRYTRKIIMDIQFEVGAVPTGKMTEVDVQAVARRQQEMNDAGEKPVLKVDGMAGPRTLPSIFKIGLAKDEELDAFTDTASALLADPQGKSDEEIALELVADANKRMDEQKIPPMKIDTKQELVGRGAFNAETWQLLLDKRQFTDPVLRNMKDMTGTIYHEARHAEQNWRIAQMQAGRGFSAKRINDETSINLDIAKLAVKDPLKPGTMEAVIAEGWHDSLFSDAGFAKRQQNNKELKAAFDARQAARKANKENPSPANQAKQEAAEAHFDKIVAEHDDLPHEFDAERLEDRVEKAL
jgi:hypothetical protein